jgi:hypothetical protein
LYSGSRLLIKRGITERGEKLAEIEATLDARSFAFQNTINAIKLDDLKVQEQEVILGIIWSSLALYYYFLTCSTWGFWHHEIHLSEYLRLPVKLPKNARLLRKISNLTKRLAQADDNASTLLELNKESKSILEFALDEVIFDLYELNDEQRDRIRDFCSITLDFFYNGTNSNASKAPSLDELSAYKIAFLDVWQERLSPKGKELEARIYAPVNGALVGMSFDLKKLHAAKDLAPLIEETQWRRLFNRLVKALPQAISQRVYLDRVVKIFDGSSMFIIKRAEKRYWTKSQARQDAHELLTEVFKAEWQRSGKR